MEGDQCDPEALLYERREPLLYVITLPVPEKGKMNRLVCWWHPYPYVLYQFSGMTVQIAPIKRVILSERSESKDLFEQRS